MKRTDLSPSIVGLHEEELRACVQERGFPAFHGTQIFNWIYRRQTDSFDLMTDIPKRLRDLLKRDFTLDYFKPSETIRSQRGDTVKYFFPLDDGNGIEAVVLRNEENRTTFCISCQIGCPVGCMYCATGRAGFVRNLSADEIVTQVLSLMKRHSVPDSILFMGMGEPLLNLPEVRKALSLFYEMGISPRRVTVSTCGLVKGIYELAHSGLKPRLALSLGSALEAKRKKMIPFARGTSMQQLKQALIEYREKTRRRVTIEYTLIGGMNDSIEDAEALAAFARSVRAHVNLIRYNPLPKRARLHAGVWNTHMRFVPPSHEVMDRFRRILEEHGVQVTERYRRGDDIEAACGQLLHYRR